MWFINTKTHRMRFNVIERCELTDSLIDRRTELRAPVRINPILVTHKHIERGYRHRTPTHILQVPEHLVGISLSQTP